jgi:DNA polymerase type B, organellar and viral
MRRLGFRSPSSLRRPRDRQDATCVWSILPFWPRPHETEKLGADLGLSKIVLPAGYAKDRMDLFLAERRNEFVNYAMTDSRIAALWTARIFNILSSLGVERAIATLGAASVHLARQELADQHVDYHVFLGLEKRRRGKPTPMATLVGLWPFAAQCYHGGKNIAFALGLSPEGRELVDVDLKSAYTTALALIRVPDWNTARQSTEVTDLAVVEDAMTFAYVKFAFPAQTGVPSLPVRTSKGRGLVYPLEGESWCTGPEVAVALHQGARIEALSGWRVEWQVSPTLRPFEGFTRRINEIRAGAKQARDLVLDKTAKEIGNSLYGKIAQAVASQRVIPDDIVFRRTFDTKLGKSGILGPSAISQPMFAAYCTGLVRAALCEAISLLPPAAWLASATTDGFLFAGDIGNIVISGPVARAFTAARLRITPDNGEIWEEKHRVPRALVMKTRGTFTVAPPDWRGDAVCAQAGYRLADADAAWLTDLERSVRWIEHYRHRDYSTRFENPSLTPLRDQHNKGLDLQRVERLTRWNADFDLKRRLINVRDVDGLIAADTVPWQTIEEFESARDGLENWRKSQRRTLKTAADYHAMTNWTSGSASRRALGATGQNRLPPLALAALLATIHGAFRVSRPTYKMVAQIWTALCGVPINETNVKDAKRRGGAPDALQGSVACFTFEDEAFARALLSWRIGAWDILKELCKPGSQAAMRVETIVDLVLLEGVPDAEFDDSEPDDDPDFDEDVAPDFEFPMEAAPPLDFACANAH